MCIRDRALTVLISETASAPPRCAASAGGRMLETLGVSLTMTGIRLCVLHQRVDVYKRQASIARNPATSGLPVSGIGGIENWRDAAEFMAVGAANVQVCTAAMLYGFKIVEEMIDDLSAWMDEKGYARVDDFVGKATPRMTEWQHLNLDYVVKARIDQELCLSLIHI